MAKELSLYGRRGGNNHPIAVRQWIINHLATVGEDYISGMHRAYKEALRRAFVNNPKRKTFYHTPNYFSFYKKVWELIKEGVIVYSGREEESDIPQLAQMEEPPVRRYLRLA